MNNREAICIGSRIPPDDDDECDIGVCTCNGAGVVTYDFDTESICKNDIRIFFLIKKIQQGGPL